MTTERSTARFNHGPAASQRAPARLDSLRMTSLLCAAAWILVPSIASAASAVRTGSESPASVESIEGLREKTRQSVSNFSGDQVGDLDDATSLGQSLPSGAKAIPNTSQEPVARSPDRPKAAPVLGDDFTLPPMANIDKKRVLPRPRAEATLSNPLVSTPDFSRQKLAFSQLAGTAVIGLPTAELGDQKPMTRDTDTNEALGLADLVSLGLEYSPVMEQVQAQLDTAISHVRQSRADLLPKLSFRRAKGPETTTTVGTTNNHTTFSQTLALTQPIINLPIVYAWMGDLSAREAAEWRQTVGRESVSQAVSDAVINLAATRLVMDYADEQLQDFNQLLEYIQTRAQAGAVSQSDVERTRTRVLAARQARIDQQANYRNALSEIERLTGITPRALKLPYLNQMPGLPLTLGAIRDLVRENNPDLSALRSDVESQEKTVVSEYGRMLPALGVSVEKDRTENIRGTNAQVDDRRVMAVLTWDISLGGKEFFAGRSASSELTNRRAKLKEETERALQQTDADFASLQSATLRIGSGEAEQRAAAAVVAATREQLKNGRLSSLLDALDAVDRHFAARQRLVLALSQQMQAQAKLLRRIGILGELRGYSNVKLADADTAVSEASPLNSKSEETPARVLERAIQASQAKSSDQSSTEKR